MLQRFVKTFGGDPNKREIEKITGIVEQINALEPELEALDDGAVRARTDAFRARIAAAAEGLSEDAARRKAEREAMDEILPEAFAVVREAAKRTIGQRHFDVQMIGGIVLHQGRIAEMRTGEGKTLVATLPIYLNALAGRGVHLITVNDYLARYQSRWMAQIYNFLGLSVGLLQMASVTENGKKAFVIDLAKESAREDQHQLRLVDRREAYAADITYGTNAEFGFDYLRDNMVMRREDKVQRGHAFAIVDEVDNVLIDEARTPLIISGPASGDVEWYGKMAALVRQLRPEDYEVNEKDRGVTLTEIGTAHVEQLLGQPLRDPDRPEDVTPEQARLLGYLEQALRAQHLFKRNKDYLVQAGKVVIVDEFTGRLMPGRRWSDGLHQAVEAKEGVRVEPENVTYATITLQNYFRMYAKLAGMTGTALTEAEEFSKIYNLEVLPIPTNLEYQAFGPEATLVEVREKDKDGYEYAFFSRREDAEKAPVFWRRKDYPDVIYRTGEAKLRAIAREILVNNVLGRPVLVGTTSVENSERLSGRLRAEPVRRLLQILILRHAWLEAHDRFEDGRAIPELVPFNKPLDQLRPEDLRPLYKELSLSLNPEDAENLKRLAIILELGPEDEPRLRSVLQGGVPHQVLNARKHTEESMIIAGAGAFGAVTIATNMAGRGVDIKLGGELAEEVLNEVNRVLRKAGVREAYDLSMQQRREALQQLDTSQYGIYETEVRYFLQHFADMERVRELGGLHIVGSERHEARRIDNQLRGRAARQGDPGSSRFFLSLEDELMRLFGGEQVKNVMERLSIDDDYPMQARMVSNMIEQSQHRVEGANFDVRKHLLEYDDVLNSQRQRIYAQRDRVFEKEDLGEDVEELLSQEVARRVKETAASEEYWRLMGWLEQIQPVFNTPQGIFPSFLFKTLLAELNASLQTQELKPALLDLADRALQAGQEHFLAWALEQIDRAGSDLEQQVDERREALDTALDGLAEDLENETRRPNAILEELSSLARTPLRLDADGLNRLTDDPRDLSMELAGQIESGVRALVTARLAATLEYRMGEPLGLNLSDLQDRPWDETATEIEARLRQALDARQDRLLGPSGQIAADLEAAFERIPERDDQAKVKFLMVMGQGSRKLFDAKTHREVRQVFTRLHYAYLGGELAARLPAEELQPAILEHLQAARQAQLLTFGESERIRLGEAARDLSAQELGRRVQGQIYRQVLLGAISELWVDYLTRVEALRVSIGLEAYAQRDPLVQYKSQASQMFQNLLAEIRAGVIGRIFLYQPRPANRAVENVPAPVSEPAPRPAAPAAEETGKKRKRHRH
jgi:preprotein translocase subunit SecA